MTSEAAVLTKSSEVVKFGGTVRLLREDDLSQIKLILETWVKSRDTGLLLPEEVEKNLQSMHDSCLRNDERIYFVAEESDGRVVGVIGMTHPSDVMLQFSATDRPVELVNAYVAKDQRYGKGVGRALVSKLEEEARKRGNTEIILNSGPRYKDSGWGFYDKLEGFQRIGVAEKLYGENGDAPVWHKVLTRF